ncbi:MAG: glycogen/starch synthase [Flavobacteriales bacterium]|nr:glycogen/starch synthase [Flavobacteriales bacterium]|tara:strand:- start:753 stop:1577 length:825 start_codon:yes stop_codon:yes gene_type:complete
MDKKRVLFISQEITPYLCETEISTRCRNLPQGIMEKGKDIRIFMPKYGCINERRNQLHEVIRLSGMNMILDNLDYPLIIKVASLQPVRMQVYFIENEDYFPKKTFMHELDGEEFEFHDERAIFFCRGVLETVRKLGWAPNIVHCHGWMSALVPMYLKKAFAEDPIFDNTKVVYSVYDQESNVEIDNDMARKSIITGVNEDDVQLIKQASVDTLHQLAIKYADAIIMGSEKISDDLNTFIADSDKYVITHQSDEEFIDAYDALYDELLEDVEVYS